MAKKFETARIRVENKHGYFEGYFDKDGYFFVDWFVIHRRYRGKGKAKLLARMIPEKAKLYAYPLYGIDKGSFKGLDPESLVKFYESLGFKPFKADYGGAATYMKRG